ncbi:MAG: translocation/assembly module TamB, partial [Parabacteroides sp.]
MLQVPYVQHKASEWVTSGLSDYLGVPVRVGNIDIEWLNHILLKELYLEDEEGQVMFEANRVSAGFEFFPLLKGKLVFSTARLFSFRIQLRKKSPTEPLNLQFLIDAFASKDTTRRKTNVDLQINSILLRKGNFSFDIESEPQTPGKFNPKHVGVQDLSASISLRAFNKDSLNATIKKLSCKERSGFVLEQLALQAVGNRDSAWVKNLEARLPSTTLRIPQANMTPAAWDSLPALWSQAQLQLSISPSRLCLKDIAPFVPALKNFTDTLDLSAEASGTIEDIHLNRLTLKYSDKMLFVGEMGLKNIREPQEAYLSGKVNKMYVTIDGLADLLSNFGEKPVKLPDPLLHLGTINFTGSISGYFNHLIASGKLASAIGSLQTDVIFGKTLQGGETVSFLKGELTTGTIQLHELFRPGNPYGHIRLHVDLDAQRNQAGLFSGSMNTHIQEFDFKGYKYENILLDGDFKSNAFAGKISIDDPNVGLFMEGLFENRGAHSVFNFSAQMDHCRLDQLNLTQKYEEPEISFKLDADFTGNTIDNIEGNVRLDDLSFKTAVDDYFLKTLEINASGHAAERRLTIESDILNGSIEGAYSFKTIVPSLIHSLQYYVPALIPLVPKQRVEENNFNLLLTIGNTEALSKAFKLPFTLVTPGRISGQYDNRLDKFRFEVWMPKFKVGNSLFESGYLAFNNPDEKVNLELRTINYNLLGRRNYINLKAEAKDNRLQTRVSWANNKERLFKADLASTTCFSEGQDDQGKKYLHTDVDLHESALVFNDSIWQLAPAKIRVHQGVVDIEDFRIRHGNQFAYIRGHVSHDPTDTLYLDLNQIELAYIFDILGNPVLQFAGKATGKFNINDLYGSRIMNTDLEVQDFSFNQVNLGRLNLFSEWDDEQQGILMLGSIYQNDSTWSDVNGYIYPVGPNAGLSLHFDAKEVNVAFINPFVQKVAQNLRGSGSGQVHLYGPFKDLNVAGDAYVKDAGLGIEFTNTYYTFSDSIHMDSTSVQLHQVKLSDKFGNQGTVDLQFNHKHFRDFDFDVQVDADKVLMYDVTQKQNPLIF